MAKKDIKDIKMKDGQEIKDVEDLLDVNTDAVHDEHVYDSENPVGNSATHDKKIVDVSNEVDNFLMSISEKHNLHPLNISSIIIARTMIMCKHTNCLEDFNKVMTGITEEITELGDFYPKDAGTEVTKH